MKRIMMILGIVLLLSCNKDNNNNNSTYIDTCIYFTVHNTNGDNLLDPNVNGAYPHNNIKVYVEGLDKVKHPMESFIHENQCIVTYCDPMDKKTDEISTGTMKLELKEGEVEEIKYEILYFENGMVINKVWYHEEMVYNRVVDSKEPPKSPSVNIIK